MAATKTLEERQNDFKERLKRLYPDYELLSEYVNGDTKVKLKYKKTGYIWEIKPRDLNGKRQCKDAALEKKSKNTKRFTKEVVLDRIKNNFPNENYDIKFNNNIIKNQSDIITVTHGKCKKTFNISIKDFLSRKKGCPYCYKKAAKTVKEINEQFQAIEDLKDYECTERFKKDGHVYGHIIHHCKKCNNNEFDIRISDMLSKHEQRCRVCSVIDNESKAVKKIKKYLDENNINYKQEVKYKTCRDIFELPFDFYLTDYDLLIEYDGEQHFKASGFFKEENVFNIKRHDRMKDAWCKKNNKDLLRINYKQDPIQILEEYLNENYDVVEE